MLHSVASNRRSFILNLLRRSSVTAGLAPPTTTTPRSVKVRSGKPDDQNPAVCWTGGYLLLMCSA